MSDTKQNLEEFLFEAALGKSSATERAAFLDGACRDNPALRARLDLLLEGHFAGEGFLTGVPEREPVAPTVTALMPPAEAPAQMLGRYKLLEKIGEGGFGEVWMAEQREPVKRRVALKLIKLGMDSRQIVARFEAERQALAMMDHANIAKIFDAGMTDTGRPYFVMELVRGIKITEYCDQNQLPTKERLDLFMKVCQAIQHAHQKGIIHRDIKPSNILVTLHDGVPVPKVIDFGIAKATQGELTDKTVFTQFQQFIGTPAYISPEQAEMSGLDIDTRADIYSLGVLLYELLVGQTPFDAKEMMQGGIDALVRIIREREPMRPSTKLSQILVAADVRRLQSPSSDRPATDEENRASSRRLLRIKETVTLLRGDLDWIVMKCLEKDRTRRYDTANGLAMDIHRHLHNEPVAARAPSPGYKFRKFVRRNKVVLGASVTIAFLAIALLASAFLLFKEFKAGKWGGITVHSNPKGAEVWRGGQRIGITPFVLSGIPIGEFTYSLVLNNYETVTNTTSLAPKKLMNDFTFLRRVEPPGTGTVTGLSTNLMELTATESQGATILDMLGKVEVARRGSAGWMLAQTNMAMSIGDRLRTGLRSRATLRFADYSQLRLNQLTIVEISPRAINKLEKPSLKLNDGSIHFFHRDGSTNSIPVTTPGSKVQIRG